MSVHLVVAVLILLHPSGAIGAELAPDVLAQAYQSGGRAGAGTRGVRIFIDGRSRRSKATHGTKLDGYRRRQSVVSRV
jgi:hypothetical protein